MGVFVLEVVVEILSYGLLLYYLVVRKKHSRYTKKVLSVVNDVSFVEMMIKTTRMWKSWVILLVLLMIGISFVPKAMDIGNIVRGDFKIEEGVTKDKEDVSPFEGRIDVGDKRFQYQLKNPKEGEIYRVTYLPISEFVVGLEKVEKGE